MTPVIFGKYEIGVFTDDGRYISHGRKIDVEKRIAHFNRLVRKYTELLGIV